MIQASLTTAFPSYTPGNTVTALLKVSSLSQPSDMIELEELEVSLVGIERVDTSWVSWKYRSAVPPLNSDKRRVQRSVVDARMRAITQGSFSEGKDRNFLIRFQLPSCLPPSFRGTAVRYVYYMEASVSYSTKHLNGVDKKSGPGLDEKRGISSRMWGMGKPKDNKDNSSELRKDRTSSRVPFHIWPMKDDSMLAYTCSNTPRNTVDERKIAQIGTPDHTDLEGTQSLKELWDSFCEGILPKINIKCWELSHSTEVEDAVSHIENLNESLGRKWSGVPPEMNTYHQEKKGDAFESSESTLSMAQSSNLSTKFLSKEDIQAFESSQNTSHSSLIVQQQQSSRSQEIDKAVALENKAQYNSINGPEEGSTERNNTESSFLGCQPRAFRIRFGSQPLANVSLHLDPIETTINPGSTFYVNFDFPLEYDVASFSDMKSLEKNDNEIKNEKLIWKCAKITGLLEREEFVSQKWDPRSIESDGELLADKWSPNILRKVIDEHVQVTLDASFTNFMFTIPMDATPSFQTPLVTTRWFVRFEMLITVDNSGTKNDKLVENLSWKLPLVVVSP